MSLIEDFLAHLEYERGCSINTLKGYAHDLHTLEKFLDERNIPRTERGEIDWGKVELSDLRAFLRWLGTKKGNKISSIHRRVCSVKAFFRFLKAERVIADDPASELKYPKRPNSLPKFLTVDEVKLLLETKKKNPTHQVILEVLYSTGCRVSELCGMNMNDVDLENRQIIIRSGKGAKDRIVLLSERAANALRDYIEGYRAKILERKKGQIDSDSQRAVFLSNRGKRISKRTVQHIVAKLSDELGVRHTTPHMLRHSMASHLTMKHLNLRVLQQLLGHASLDTTQIYANVTAEHVRDEFRDKLPIS